MKIKALSKRRHWPGVVSIAMVILVITIALIAAATPSLLPASPGDDTDILKVAGTAIFVTSYLTLAIGKVPGLNIDRAGIALVP